MSLTETQLQAIRTEVERGLAHQAPDLHAARRDLATYDGTWRDPERSPYAGYDNRSDRDIPVMQKIVDALTGSTYKATPARVLSDEQATEWLEQVYRDQRMTPYLRDADRYAHASDIFAFQVHATGNSDQPIKVYGWTSDSFVAWTDRDDPTKVVAVCVLDEVEDDGTRCRKRYRLWTEYSVSTYLEAETGKADTSAVLISEETHPYGILPFTFVHYRLPTRKFCSPGIGKQLAEAQRHINWRLMHLADAIRFSKPKCFVEGLDPAWKPPVEPRPGEWLALPVQLSGAGQEPTAPKVVWTGPDLDFVTKEWDDLRSYWSWLLQSVGVPPASLPLDNVVAAPSGVAVVAEQIPLLLYAIQRQEAFRFYEDDLAHVVCTVGYTAYGLPFLGNALTDWQFTIHFPDVTPDLPPQDPDNYQYTLFERGALSKIQWVQKTLKLTREEAITHLAQIAEDEAELATIMPRPPTVAAEEVDDAITGEGGEETRTKEEVD